MISIIVAAAENNVIGNNNDLIWHLPADLQFFKKTTSGNTIIMGRKTYESIGRPLPNRQNIVITRNSDLKIEGVDVVTSMDEALKIATSQEKFIVGGGQIYKDALLKADRVFLTRVHQEFEGDTTFPVLNENEWKQVSRIEGTLDEKNTIPHSFLTFQRK